MDKYIGRLLDNRYEILEVIGSGGMAVVYKARCHRLNRLVAIKVLKDDFLGDKEFRDRFHGESQAVAMLSHPNIVAVYDVSTSLSGDVDYIVMELIEGITLKQYMEKKGTLNWKETLHFAIQIAKALEHAHSRGVVHRDIKPHNVMVLKNGAVKVADFGIARMMSEGNTLTKEALGSVHYISPEQAKGGRVDNRSDIYSLGVVMYEMMAGRPPYEGESPVSVAIQHINGGAVAPSTLNPNIPRGMEQIILRAMAHEIENRYVSATQMLTDMDEFRKDPEILFHYSTPAVDEAMKLRKPALVLDPMPRRQERTPKTAPAKPASAPAKPRPIRQAESKSQASGSKKSGRASPVAIVAIIMCGLIILALLGALIWTVVKNVGSGLQRMVDVPTLKGKYYDQLPNYDDVKIVVGEYVFHETYEEGKIVSQDVTAGSKVNAGTVIKVNISKGPEVIVVTYTMPDVVSKRKSYAEDAMKELKETLGLEITIAEIASDEKQKGIVLATSPIAGTKLKEGDKIVISIGSGIPDPEEVLMPGLVGYSRDEAIYELSKMGFPQPTITVVESLEIEGTVLFQSVDAGTTILNDTVIELEVAGTPDQGPEGPVSVAMPLLIGKDLETAKSILTSRGFPEPVINEVYNSREAGIVVSQNPSANGLVSTETIVVLEISKGPKPVETTPPTPEPTPEPTPAGNQDVIDPAQ